MGMEDFEADLASIAEEVTTVAVIWRADGLDFDYDKERVSPIEALGLLRLGFKTFERLLMEELDEDEEED